MNSESVKFTTPLSESMKGALFIHGFSGRSDNIWFPSARRNLESNGIQTFAVDFPNPKNPRYSEWASSMDKFIGDTEMPQKIIVIGHSLGGYFVLRYIGEHPNLPFAHKIVGIVLVSSAALKCPERKPFYDGEINWDNILSIHPFVVSFYSLDDNILGHEHNDMIVKKLSALQNFKCKVLDGYKHFQMAECPIISEEILEIASRV